MEGFPLPSAPLPLCDNPGDASIELPEVTIFRKPDCRIADGPFAVVRTGDPERGLLVVGETDSSLRCAMLRAECLV